MFVGILTVGRNFEEEQSRYCQTSSNQKSYVDLHKRVDRESNIWQSNKRDPHPAILEVWKQARPIGGLYEEKWFLHVLWVTV